MSGVHLDEFLSAYLAEMEEHLGVANKTLLATESAARKGESSLRGVRELFRALHTIKGLSSMVGVEPIVSISHRMESILRRHDRAGKPLPTTTIDVLLQGVRAIETRVSAVASRKEVPVPAQSLLDALATLDEVVVSIAPPPLVTLDLEIGIERKLASFERETLMNGINAGRRAIRVDFVPSPSRVDAGLNINSVRERVAALAEIVKVVPLTREKSLDAPGGLAFAIIALTGEPDERIAEAVGVSVEAVHLIAAAAPQQLRPSAPQTADIPDEDEGREPPRRGIVRVDVARLDDAMERLSGLIVTRFRLSRAVAAMTANGINTRELSQIVAENARQLRDLRASILRVRMVPIAEVLERVRLIVRGLRRDASKQVRLEIDAGGAELDKAVAERIFPALLHLVRNAVDHGMETPDERVRRGKPPEGLLTITARHRNTRLELEVRDDGRGIDRAMVAKRAGCEVPQSDAALVDLLCTPGLSTRDEITTTSGRGMGMDIVRRLVVDQLGGELLVESQPGLGTAFTLRVPLTVSIVDAFTFECGAQSFVVPVSMVEEIIEVDRSRFIACPTKIGGAKLDMWMIERRGVAMPVLVLETLFGGQDASRASKAIIVRRGGEAIAYAVDRMLGQQEVVVRPLEDRLVRVVGISGATDLGDGRPTLVLDLVALGGSLAISSSLAREAS